MSDKITIGNTILKAWSYAGELGDEFHDALVDGKCGDHLADKIECIIYLCYTLQHYIDIDQLSSDTDILHENLSELISDYFGDGDALDPNVFIPNTIIGGSAGSAFVWGFGTGDIQKQADLIALLANKSDIGDGFIAPVTITKNLNNIIVTVNSGNEIKVKIGSTIITQSSPQTLPVATATNNYFRKDWLAGTLTGLQIIQGVEDQTIGTLPTLGANQIGLATIDIYGTIISANPPQPPVDITAPSWKVYGNVPFGKYGNEAIVPFANSAFEQYKEAWTNVAHPNYLAPFAGLSATPSNYNLEVGESKSVSLTLAFTQRNGGSETSRTITKNGTTLSGTTDTIIISTSPVNYQGSVSYGQGAVLNNQAGIPDPIGRINSGTTSSNIITYVGSYFNFYGVGVTAINSAQVRALAGKTTSNGFTLSIPAGQTKASFAYPATKADIADSSVKYVEGFNSNVGNTFTKSLFNVNDAGGNPVAYKIYTVTLPAPEANQVTYNVTLP
jgi:hypothetical protein